MQQSFLCDVETIFKSSKGLMIANSGRMVIGKRHEPLEASAHKD